MPGSERGLLMFRLADLVEKNKELLATIETWDNGKPYGDALNGDLQEVIDCLRYYAGWADKLHGQTIPTTPLKFAYTLRQPMGVCAQIIPVSTSGTTQTKVCCVEILLTNVRGSGTILSVWLHGSWALP